MKVESKDEVLDHIYDHLIKEFKRIVKDSSKELNQSAWEVIEGLGVGMEANRLQTVLNEGTGINREELNQEIEISKIRE